MGDCSISNDFTLYAMEGQIRYLGFMKTDPSHFDGDPRLDIYMFLFGFCDRLHKLYFVDSNGLDFTYFLFFGLVRQ